MLSAHIAIHNVSVVGWLLISQMYSGGVAGWIEFLVGTGLSSGSVYGVRWGLEIPTNSLYNWPFG